VPPIEPASPALPCPSALAALGWGDADCAALPAGSHANAVLGGTFDRIHPGHKLLLAMSALAAERRLLIGVSEGALLDKKTLRDVMHPQPLRAARLAHHLRAVRPSVAYEIVPIQVQAPHPPPPPEPSPPRGPLRRGAGPRGRTRLGRRSWTRTCSVSWCRARRRLGARA